MNSSWFVLDLLMTCSWLVYFSFRSCSSLDRIFFTIFSQPMHDLFWTCSGLCSWFVQDLIIWVLLLHDLLKIGSQLVNNLVTTYSWPLILELLFYDLFTICSWIAHNLLMIRSCLVFQNLFTTYSWLVLELVTTCSQLIHNFFKTCSLLVQDFFTTCSYLVPIFLQFFHNMLMTCSASIKFLFLAFQVRFWCCKKESCSYQWVD